MISGIASLFRIVIDDFLGEAGLVVGWNRAIRNDESRRRLLACDVAASTSASSKSSRLDREAVDVGFLESPRNARRDYLSTGSKQSR
ncbi:hypothetical protein C487_18668 [Natrinema pallidum DSM 3751]|uniref:Uncharacterized protein n=1 Tax=Natrinema pallidum DSM 3751 TaxID=1227495 RepID=L9YFK7_9EURY|nr:hypothetical protein C487_18668 [Natrinema pallidum DSM 3751]